jgi:drug/metabolite transporter (DMT)-like permease
VLGNVQVVLVGVLAWMFLGERPESRTLVAIPVVLTGVVLISGVIGAGAYGDDPFLGVVYGLLTAITYSGFILVLRQGNRDIRRPAGPLLDATISGALFSALGGLLVGDLDLTPGSRRPGSSCWRCRRRSWAGSSSRSRCRGCPPWSPRSC